MPVSATSLDPIYEVPTPTPGVETFHDGTFRILANNDEDVSPSYFDSNPGTDETYLGYPSALGDEVMPSADALYATTTGDVYRTHLSDSVPIPYQDEWVTYTEWQRSGGTPARFYPVSSDSTVPTDASGQWQVVTRNQNLEPRTVYNAQVYRNPLTEELEILNSDDALVYTARSATIQERYLHIRDQYLQYSDDSSRAAVPMFDGEEVYPTASGGSVPLPHGPGSSETISDAWIGISDVRESAWYRDSYVTDNADLGAYILYDYRASAPDDFTSRSSCTRTHTVTRTVTVGNETKTVTDTHTHRYPRTRWAEFDLVDSSATVTSVSLDRPGYDGDSALVENEEGIWMATDGGRDRSPEFSPGEYELTATLEVESEVEARWGVRSSRCSEYERSQSYTRTLTRSHSVPVTIIDADASGLEIDVTVLDGVESDRTIVQWDGDQDLTGAPWSSIELEIGDASFSVDSPWRFYGVSQTTHVEERSGSDSETYPVTHTQGDAWPALVHSVTSVGNVSVSAAYGPDGEYGGLWIEESTVIDEEIPGTELPAGVVDEANGSPTYLFERLEGEFRPRDARVDEALNVRASTVFDTQVPDANIDAHIVTSELSELVVADTVPGDDPSDRRVLLRLTDPDGNPIPNREIALSGAVDESVTTNGDGEAWTTLDGPYLRASYSGDDLAGSDGRYFEGDFTTYMAPYSYDGWGATGTVERYLEAAIGSVLMFVEWIALGLLAFWWRKYISMREAPQ
ncbi:Ig-like domain-containing protein [Halomicroarcula sp. F13]|uniref:Ig-like domain-containing protein n=1 Tax=Haloarcula rubra TaxID=2487747 RepID=A0AAW4PWN4_9EURY|nr:Ig-like domain-containing protein [Halomicroarcula rubra]MBX0324763.1 Ig-like domain-containing protein [Halomicroarcula rubra]